MEGVTEALKKLEYLSVVSKVCTELESHVGYADRARAEFIIDLAQQTETVESFAEQLKANGGEISKSFVHTIVPIIHDILPPKSSGKGKKAKGGGIGVGGDEPKSGKELAVPNNKQRVKELKEEDELNPDLWRTLPDDLKDAIVDKVLGELPFSRVLSFCGICRRWKQFLLSCRYLLYFHKGKFMVFNPKTGSWEMLFLHNFRARGLIRVDILHKEYSVGGLLCFSSSMTGQFVVYNPLTRCGKKTRRSEEQRALMIGTEVTAQAALRVPDKLLLEHKRKSRRRPLQFIPKNLIIAQTVVDCSGAGNFQLRLERIYDDGEWTTQIYDSRDRGGCKTVFSIPEDFYFVANGPILLSPERVVLGFVKFPSESVVLTYEINLKQWTWTTTTYVVGALQRRRKILLATMKCDLQLRFFEVRDTGHPFRLVAVAFPPPLPETNVRNLVLGVPNDLKAANLEKFEQVRVLSLGEGDIMCFIGVLKDSLARMSVWTHYQGEGSSDHISGWDSWWSGAWEKLSATDFHIFQPSFALPYSDLKG